MPRDYKAEYRRRLERAAQRGLSRSQARGHARAHEAPLKAKQPSVDSRLASGLRLLTKTRNLTKAAKQAGVSPERLRSFALRNDVVKRSGRGWKEIRREVRVTTTKGTRRWIQVGFESASLVGAHNEAIKRARATNNPDVLAPFHGKSAIDLKGRQYPLETHLNTLHRLANAGIERFENVYRLTS